MAFNAGVYRKARHSTTRLVTEISAISVGSVSFREPMIQNTMPCKFSLLVTDMISNMSEEEIKLIITPVSRRLCTRTLPRRTPSV